MERNVDGKKILTEAGRNILRELLTQCTDKQVELFNRMYKSVDVIPLDKIPWAIEQCHRTIYANTQRSKGMKENGEEMTLEEIVAKLPEGHHAKRKYQALVERDIWLSCLEWEGVDNWEGFGYAQERMQELEAKNENK